MQQTVTYFYGEQAHMNMSLDPHISLPLFSIVVVFVLPLFVALAF